MLKKILVALFFFISTYFSGLAQNCPNDSDLEIFVTDACFASTDGVIKFLLKNGTSSANENAFGLYSLNNLEFYYNSLKKRDAEI